MLTEKITVSINIKNEEIVLIFGAILGHYALKKGM